MEVSGEIRDPAALIPRKEPLVPIDRRLGGSQSRSGCGGEEKNSQPVVQGYTTELPRLSN